jgi:rubrerythrin
VNHDLAEALHAARRAEKEQALFYRMLVTHAENAGNAQEAEDLNGLHADEQHHLSRLTVRLVEADQLVQDVNDVKTPKAAYPNWQDLARRRECEEIERYETIANMTLDSLTAALIAEILNVERQHAESLGGKYMSA